MLFNVNSEHGFSWETAVTMESSDKLLYFLSIWSKIER